jgi:hypothetical protein
MKNEYYSTNFGNLKVDFKNSNLIDEFYSQAAQDIFVLVVTNGKQTGKFLDIGASDPKIINNTFLLEKKFGWTGVQIELDEFLANKCKEERNTKVICSDATVVNYHELYNEFGEMDYLSLDIDGQPSLDTLKNIPFDKFKFKVITFEHDSYRIGNSLRDESRQILDSHGYYRICGDVANENNIYEDWYVDKNNIDIERISVLKSENKNWNEILF